MFKFMKSKKGFTLVELMIVVVIMAILVAVAVPIYSAVTRNAKTKTCAANCREIVAQCNTTLMNGGNINTTASGSVTISTTDGKVGTVSGSISGLDFSKMFQSVPCCPAQGTITVTVEGGTSDVNGEKAGSVTAVCGGVGTLHD